MLKPQVVCHSCVTPFLINMNEDESKVTVVVTLGKEVDDVKSDLFNQYALAFPHSLPKYLFVETVNTLEAKTFTHVYRDYEDRIAHGSIKAED